MTSVFLDQHFFLLVALKGSVLILLGAGAGMLLRRSSATVRHLAYALGFAAATALPVPQWLLPSLAVDIPAVAAWVQSPPAAAAVDEVEADLPGPATRAGHRVCASASCDRGVLAYEYPGAPSSALAISGTGMIYIWLGGFAFFVILLGGTRVAFVARRRRLRNLDNAEALALVSDVARRLELGRGVRLLEGKATTIPFTWGWLRPAIVLPRDFREWPRSHLLAVVEHELTHVKRKDAVWCFIADVACAMFWFNPVAWVARREMLILQELATDEMVVRAGSNRFDYAAVLVATARSVANIRSPALSSAAFAYKLSNLERRIVAITSPVTRGRFAGRAEKLVPAGVAVIAMALAPLSTEGGAADAGKAVITQSGEPAAVPTPSRVEPLLRAQAQVAAMITSQDSAESLGIGYAAAVAMLELRDATPSRVERMRRIGVVPSYVSSVRAEGVAVSSSADAIQLRIHSVPVGFASSLREAGLDVRTAEELVRLWIHRVTAQYVRSLTDAGIRLGAAHEAIRLHNLEVPAEYVRGMRRAGVAITTARETEELFIHFVKPDFVSALVGLGLQNLTAHEVRRLANFKVNPADAAEVWRAAGYEPGLARIRHALESQTK